MYCDHRDRHVLSHSFPTRRTPGLVYRAAGWDLRDDRCLQVMVLLCAMPMTMANGLARDLDRMKRLRTLLTTTAANLAPIQGEYLGGQVPHLMLIGRRGKPFFWSQIGRESCRERVCQYV